MVTRESFIDNTILRIIPKKVIKSMQDKDDNTFLHLACMAKNKAVATIAIEAGCSATKK